jgi:hypothetical protein
MPFDGTAHVLGRPKRRGWFTVRPAMYLEARKLTALLVLCTSAALVASACGDDGGGTGSGSGSGGGGTTGATGSTGTGVEDPCAVVPMGCFDPGACFANAPTGVSLRNDLVPLMQRSCTLSNACHTDKSNPTTNEGYKPYLGSKKSEGESDVPAILAAIVGVEAWGDPSIDVVTPGDWQNSYFMNKIDGALDQCGDLDCLDCGRLMPQGSPKPLPIEERNLFRAWIAEGAQDN